MTQGIFVDPDNKCITMERLFTAVPAGYDWTKNQLTDCFTEPGKQTWLPGEARLVTTAERTRLEAAYPARFVHSLSPTGT